LKKYVNVSDVVCGLSVFHRGFKPDLLGNQRSLLIKAMAKPGDNAQNLHFAVDAKANLQRDFTLDP
jgi:hypothetical protein